MLFNLFFFFSSRRRHTRYWRDWSSDVCSSDLLVSIIPTLKLKSEYADKFEIGVSDEQMKNLLRVSHDLDERLNRWPNRHAPYVGDSAFATKAGIHASAIVKEPATYEHVEPEAVGNH